MAFSLHLSVDSRVDTDNCFRGTSTSWLGGSLLVGGQRTGLQACEMSPGEAGSHADVKRSQVQMSAAETLPKQDKQHNISALHHEE